MTAHAREAGKGTLMDTGRPCRRHPLTLVLTLAVAVATWSSWFPGAGGAAPSTTLRFGSARRLGEDARNPASPFLRHGPQGRLYAVWTEDDPAQPAQARHAEHGQHHAHAGMFTSTMRVARLAWSGDGGATWSPAQTVNATMEAVQGEENEPKIAFAPDGRALVLWSVPGERGDKMRANVRVAVEDGRGGFTPTRTLNEIANTARFPTVELGPDQTFLVGWIDRRVDAPATRALYLTRLDASGRALGPASKVGVDVCECCRLAMGFADDGRTVYIVHRHVTKENVRNHVLLKSTDRGITFGAPVVISEDGWQTGCPHSGPSMALDARGRLHVTWFTLGRNAGEAGVYYSASADGGASFAPRRLVHANTAPEVLHPRLALGRDGTVYFAWDNLDAESRAQVFARALAPDGTTWSPVQQLSAATENAARPALSVSDGDVQVAWTETKGERSWIVMRAAPAE
jgi:hypothetical protein